MGSIISTLEPAQSTTGLKDLPFISSDSYLQTKYIVNNSRNESYAKEISLLVIVDQQSFLHSINQTTKELMSIFLFVTLHVSSYG